VLHAGKILPEHVCCLLSPQVHAAVQWECYAVVTSFCICSAMLVYRCWALIDALAELQSSGSCYACRALCA
jgi:hypothetical protein